MTADPLTDIPAVASEPPTTSAGTLLRGYREALGIKPEALASKLHVPVGKLLALEQDRLDALPDAMFARALTLAVCRQLQTDPAPVLARLPQKDVSRLASHDERGLDFPLKRPSLLPASGLRAWMDWPKWVWGLMALGLAGVVTLSNWSNDTAPEAASQVVVPLTAPSLSAVSPTTTLSNPTVTNSTVTNAPVTPPVEPSASTASAPVTPVPAPKPPSGKLVFTTVQPNAVVLTPVSPSINTEGTHK